MDCKRFEDLIEEYLTGTIPEEEREPFEEHYFICDKCYTSVKITENIYKKKIKIVTSGKKTPSFILKPAMIFASLLLIVFLSTFYVNYKKEMRELKNITFFKAPVFIKNETRNNLHEEKFFSAMEYYNKGEFKTALKLLKNGGIETPRILFFKGVINLINNKPEASIKSFNAIINQMDPSYFDEALYFKSIALLRMNKKNEALRELENLQNMFSPFREKAELLIEKVKNLK